MTKKNTAARMLTFALALALLAGTVAFPTLAARSESDIPAAKSSAPSTLRVLLTRLNLTDRLDVTLSGSYSAALGDASLVFVRGSDLTVLLKDGRMVLYYLGLSVDAGDSLTLLRHPGESGLENGLRFANNDSIYEGDLTLTVSEGKMRAVLTLGVEDYIKGVVPYEMSDSYPLEALKAQAVAARTYAVSRAVANAEQTYDLVDNTNDQSYRGRRDAYTRAADAVDATRGICGFYKGKLAVCYYSASNGGQTELAQNVWETKANTGYLDMRDDPYDLENPNSKVISILVPKTAAEVHDTPYAVRALLAERLHDTLVAAGYDPSPESLRIDRVSALSVDTPKYAAPSRVMTMLHITFAYSARTRTDPVPAPTQQMDASSTSAPAVVPDTPTVQAAAVLAAAQADNDEEVSLYTPEPTPQPTPTPSAPPPTLPPAPTPTPQPSYGPFIASPGEVRFDIAIFPDAERALSLGINSYDNELVTIAEQPDSYAIESRRFGHGVGLSQRGAEWMAGRYSKTYTDILAFYYPGLTLMRFDEPEEALPTVAPALLETAGPVPTPTPRPTLMPVTQALPEGAWYATVTEIDDDSSLNLRATPDLNGSILLRLYKNQPLLVLEECPQEGWVRVRTDVVEGYVMRKYLTAQPTVTP